MLYIIFYLNLELTYIIKYFSIFFVNTFEYREYL